MLFVYRILINFAVIISPIIIIFRLFKKKEDPKRFKEKFCIFSQKKPKGKVIWFHGSSVGELLSIIPIIEKLENKKDINKILITSSTLSSSLVLSKYKFKKTIHQFFPIDTNFFTNKFLKYWNPHVAIFIESEIWPNMIDNIKKKSIPLVLLNARITKKSFKRWRLVSSLSINYFEKFNLCLPQNKETEKYLKLLGASKIKNSGNLKFSELENTNKDKLDKNLKNFFNSKKVWCASSTHHLEEIICAESHIEIKKKFPNLMTVIIPRHIQRISKITKDLKKLNLNVHHHSSSVKPNKNTDIYLVDTYGETKKFFKVCKTVFLGGSIINHGGQNPLEAARIGCQIIYGPNIKNFKEIYGLLDKNNISFKIKNLSQLTNLLKKLINSNLKSNNKIDKLKKIGTKILQKNLNELENFLK